MGACLEFCDRDSTEVVIEGPNEQPKKVTLEMMSNYEVLDPTVSAKLSANEQLIQDKKREVQAIIAAGKPWTDPDFPPQLSSLYDPNIDEVTPKIVKQFSKYEWKRAASCFKNPEVFVNDVSPNDIQQGVLGDCYFLSVLASLVETNNDEPSQAAQRLKEHFITETINQAGIYMMIFYVNGLATPVVVDDFIPTKNNTPVFASTKDQELWVILLEKGWAKLHGTYLRTEGGLPSFACMHLLNTPTSSYCSQVYAVDEAKKDELWKILRKADRRGHHVMAASEGQGEEKSSLGVISGHAYSLIAAKEIQVEGQSTIVRLCMLRNPWGSGEWTGDWSDKSPLWTPELRQKYGCTDEDDGTFHIPYENYLQEYAWTSVAVNRAKEYKEASTIKSFAEGEKEAYFSFELKEDQFTDDIDFCITVCQQGQRLEKYRLPNKPFVASNINIALMTMQGELIETSIDYEKFWASLVVRRKQNPLKAGTYVIMVTPIWNESANEHEDYKKIIVNIFSQEQTVITQMKGDSGYKVLAASIVNLARTVDESQHRQIASVKGAYQVISLEVGNLWYGYICVFNTSKKSFTAVLTPEMNGLEVMRLDLNQEGGVTLQLGPKTTSLIILRRVSDNGVSFNMKTSITMN